jgi:hypothetical protein
MLLIKRLTKVTNDPTVQGAGTINVVGVGSHQDRRNRVTRLDERFMELDAGRGDNAVAPTCELVNLFSGSGTTIVVAEITGRDCHAIELMTSTSLSSVGRPSPVERRFSKATVSRSQKFEAWSR